MSHPPTEKVADTSGDVLAGQIDGLRKLFPEVFAEGKIDFDKLRATLGAAVDSGPGRFSFTWAGKDDAISLLQTPSRATLVPCPEESVGFDATGNAFIEGDNLEVLKLLFKPYFGRVKLVYIDPPYNTGQDFVYPDDYADPLKTYLELTGQADGEGNRLTSNPETSGRYHSSWLSMMYPRLFLARQLLRDDGAIFVSIDDHEVHHLRMLMNEVFGEENFVANVVWQKKYAVSSDAKGIPALHDYLIVFQKGEEFVPRLLPRTEKQDVFYKNLDNDSRGLWRPDNLTRSEYRERDCFPITSPKTGKVFLPPKGASWRHPKDVIEKMIADNRIWFGADGNSRPVPKRFLSEVRQGIVASGWWPHEDAGHNDESKKELQNLFDGDSPFDTPKPSRLLKRVLTIASQPNTNDIIVDFFAGSCTTAHAVLEMNRMDGGNRRFIMVQLPQPTGNKDYPTIAEIGKERIRRVIAKLAADAKDTIAFAENAAPEDLGFKVFKLAAPNILPWNADFDRDPDAYARKLSLFNDPLAEGWTATNVLWEVALREGYGLNTRFEARPLANGNTVHEVSDPETGQRFLACLDDKVGMGIVKCLALGADRLFVCRDVALDDSAAANLALQCRLKTI